MRHAIIIRNDTSKMEAMGGYWLGRDWFKYVRKNSLIKYIQALIDTLRYVR